MRQRGALGADGDGAIGIKRIKERGGLTIAQDPAEAEHNAMPRSAIETGMIDWVLNVAQMPQRVLTYFQQAKRSSCRPRRDPQPAKPVPAPPDRRRGGVAGGLTFLRTRTGGIFPTTNAPPSCAASHAGCR
jgi:two-component system CheB/CheR fusion protein